jgi:gluconokinase
MSARATMIVVLMGVSGSGKTTVGKLLAAKLGWPFFEGDDFHPEENVDKLRRGVALSEADRAPWLAALARLIDELEANRQDAVIACSALRETHRERLRHAHASIRFVYLKGDQKLIQERLKRRKGHYMDPALLADQFATLEEPHDALVVDISAAPAVLADRIAAQLTGIP